jgi:alpha-galactosidase
MEEALRGGFRSMRLGLLASLMVGLTLPSAAQQAPSLENGQLSVTLRPQDGSYEIRIKGLEHPVLGARVGAEINHRWVRSSDYPKRRVAESPFQDTLGRGHQITATFLGVRARPDLVCVLRLYDGLPFGDVEVIARNKTARVVTVQAIRSVEATGVPRVDLGGREAADRVLSDSFSEDWPALRIYDLGRAPKGRHRGVGSQLIYNQESKQSLFLGALTSERFLTILRLSAEGPASADPKIASYTVDSTGTTEIQREESGLGKRPVEDQVALSLLLPPGKDLASERVMFAAGGDYHAQLEAYGEAIRRLHHARVSGSNLTGWWSWTAFYGGITEGTALTNAHWLAEHLKGLGYDYFHIDEGYQYARGEYTTPNAVQFPHGMRPLGHEVCLLGLKLGLWTAPFEVVDRAWVYEHHKDWLVHNARRKPIRVGSVRPGTDPLYVLDTTHPGAQQYLSQTYRTLVREWGVRYIKLDFMDTTAIEGYHYRPNTTALQAQRMGLEVIRKAVGPDVLLDKDGSPMLNPVGIVDEGRVSVDTGHSFQASKEADPGIAARYYMHRNFFVNDPDAFTVAGQLLPEQEWHQSRVPLTLDEAKVSIVLSAVSGGMYEIGDDLPTLGSDPDRLALVENRELLQMAKLGRAALPLDLMTYGAEDEQPSLFRLQEDPRQTMLAVFNWAEERRSHKITSSDLGFQTGHSYQAYDVLDQDKPVAFDGDVLALEDQPPHSVRLIKFVDASLPPAPPTLSTKVPAAAEIGQPVKFSAASGSGVPVLSYHWEFGDGTSAEGAEVAHTYTRTADQVVQLTAEGMDGIPARESFRITIGGTVRTRMRLQQNRRYVEANDQ